MESLEGGVIFIGKPSFGFPAARTQRWLQTGSTIEYKKVPLKAKSLLNGEHIYNCKSCLSVSAILQ